MALFLGIDGGGTHTRCCLADESGRVLARAEAGLGNLHHGSEEEIQAHLAQAVHGVFEQSGTVVADCRSVFAGMAGVTCESTAERVRGHLRECGLETARIGVDHDIRIALAGGLAGQPGIALIVGTGSSCYGRDAGGRTWQSGGWGALVADEGSAYWLGREAITAAVRQADGRMPAGALGPAVFAWLGIASVSEVLRRLHEDGLTRTEIAAFAPRVVQMAAAGDPAAVAIARRGADELADMAAANHAQLPTSPTPSLVITGGLGTAPTVYRTWLVEAIRARVPGVRIPDPALDPAAGAVLLALDQDQALSDPTLQTLRRTAR